MSKRLELLFTNMEGSNVTIAIDDPIDPVDPELVTSVMDKVIENDVFISRNGPLVQKRGARVVERHVETIDITLE